jgi:hypothetical protein
MCWRAAEIISRRAFCSILSILACNGDVKEFGSTRKVQLISIGLNDARRGSCYRREQDVPSIYCSPHIQSIYDAVDKFLQVTFRCSPLCIPSLAVLQLTKLLALRHPSLLFSCLRLLRSSHYGCPATCSPSLSSVYPMPYLHLTG